MSRFWRNFWSETGRNTGKWISNKTFGDSGWATPRRHILDGELRGSKRSKNRKSSPQNSNQEYENYSNSDDDYDLTEKLNSIDFGDSIDEICDALDKIFPLLEEAGYVDDGAVKDKIQSGIFRLKRKGANIEADFYRKRLGKKNLTKTLILSFCIFIVLFGALATHLGWLD